MAEINNVFERAITLLASQFRERATDGNLTNFQKLIKVFAESAQDIQDVIQQLKTQRNLFDAEGIQLDRIGEILGLTRLGGESDSDYRERLQFQIFINQGFGTPEELLRILAFLTNATETGIIEIFPASYQLYTNGLTFPDPPEELVDALTASAPAGVQRPPIVATYGVDLPFAFAQDAEIELLFVTDPNNSDNLVNLELDTGELLFINPATQFTGSDGGHFAEFGNPIDTEGAGQLSEVIMFQGSLPVN